MSCSAIGKQMGFPVFATMTSNDRKGAFVVHKRRVELTCSGKPGSQLKVGLGSGYAGRAFGALRHQIERLVDSPLQNQGCTE